MSIGVDFIEPGILFNLLNQEFKYPCISDPVYMLLLDARLRKNYEESHIITARCVKLNEKNQFIIPNDYELSCKTHVIVYDLDTVEISFESKAFRCAREMWRNGSRNPVKLLQGGYKLFSSIYPFLRTRKIIYLPRELDLFETYPCEVIRGQLYLGRRAHANMAFIQRDLKIERHVNCSGCPSILYPQIGRNIITLNIRTNVDMTFYTKIQTICNFIDLDYNTGGAVLVYSEYGSNRSAAVVVAYVIYVRMCSYEEALALVQGYCPKVCICRKLADQLKIWAKDIHTNPFAIELQNRLKNIKPSEALLRESTIEVCGDVSSSACTMEVVRLREHEETEEDKELEVEEVDAEYFKSFVNTFGEEEDAEEDSWNHGFVEEEVPQSNIGEVKSKSKKRDKLQYDEEEGNESDEGPPWATYEKEINVVGHLEDEEAEEIEEDIEEYLDEDIEEHIEGEEEVGPGIEEMDKKAGNREDIQEDIKEDIQ